MSGVLYGGLRTAATDRLRDLIARRRTRKLVAALPAAAIPKGCTARSLSAQNGVSVLVVDTEPELILRVAGDAEGRATILRHRRALAELHQGPRCERLAPRSRGSWRVIPADRGWSRARRSASPKRRSPTGAGPRRPRPRSTP